MSPSDHTQIPTDHLRAVGARLGELGYELIDVNNRLKTLEGEDEIHGHKMVQAVYDFYSKHFDARNTRIQSTIAFGDFTIRIADATDKLDGDMARAFNENSITVEGSGWGAM